MICTYYLSYGVSMVTETSGTRTGTLDSEYENIGIIPIYFVFHCPLGLTGERDKVPGGSTIPDNFIDNIE